MDIERKTHSERVIPAIDSLLQGSGITMQEIEALAIAYGPGSFTGLRIGVGTVKALSLSLNIPVYKVDTLEALASQIGLLMESSAPFSTPGAASLRGCMGEQTKQDIFACVMESESFIDELLLNVPKGDNLFFVGEGAISERDSILQTFPHATIVTGTNSMLHPGSVGLRALKAGTPVDADSLLPNYLRKSEAEVKRGL